MLRGIFSGRVRGIFLNNSCRRSRGQQARAQRIKNSFAGEWFYDTSSIAGKQEITALRGNCRAC